MSGGFFGNVNQQINMNATASSSTNWRLTLSDDERKTNVSMLFKLLDFVKTFNANQRFIASKKWEEEAYNKSSSKEEYSRTIAGRMHQIKQHAQQQNQQTAAVQQQATQVVQQQAVQQQQQQQQQRQQQLFQLRQQMLILNQSRVQAILQQQQQQQQASSSADWRLTLSDEERKTNVNMLFKLLDYVETSNTRFIASKKWEDDAHKKANSKDEYSQIMTTRMRQIKQHALLVQQQSGQQTLQQAHQILQSAGESSPRPTGPQISSSPRSQHHLKNTPLLQDMSQLNVGSDPSSNNEGTQAQTNINIGQLSSSIYVIQTGLAVLNEKEALEARNQIAILDARAKERRIKYNEIHDLTYDEKTKIIKKLNELQPMYHEVDKVLPYFWHYTKSSQGAYRFLGMKYMIEDQLKALPDKFLLRLELVDNLLQQFRKCFVFVENRMRGNVDTPELNNNPVLPQNHTDLKLLTKRDNSETGSSTGNIKKRRQSSTDREQSSKKQIVARCDNY